MAWEIEILYEDKYIIAVNKPAGLPMHSNLDLSRENLADLLEAELRGAGRLSERLSIHQRLDLGTTGAVLFAKDRAANPSLARQFAEHSVRKIYAALTGSVRLKHKSWECSFPLAEPLKRGGPVRWSKASAPPEGFKAAGTDFRLLKRGRGGLLLQAELHSGRRHQIRAHLAAQDMPILGDELYGGCLRAEREGRSLAFTRPMLHARYLRLAHPAEGHILEIKAPWPEDFRRVCRFLEIDIDEFDVQA